MPALTWFRRSSARVLLIGLVPVVAAVLTSRSGWQWQGQWATSWAVGSTIVLAPLLAGVAAFDVQRAFTPTLQLMTASTVRGVRGALALPLALLLGAFVPWSLGLVYAIGRSAATTGDVAVGWWLVAHGIAALVAAASVGATIGVLVPNLAAGPVAAIATYLLPMALMPLGIEGLLAAGGATAPTFGLEPDLGVVAVMIGANVALAGLGLAVTTSRLAPPRRRAPLVPVAGAVALVAALMLLSSMQPRMALFRPTSAPDICVGVETVVCGPADASALLAAAATDLDEARLRLLDLGLRTNRSYAFRPESPGNGEAGLLQVEATAMVGSALGEWDRAHTLATPTVCADYFAPSPPEELLYAQARLASWIADSLAGRQSAAADEKVLGTFTALRTCASDALPEWEYDGW